MKGRRGLIPKMWISLFDKFKIGLYNIVNPDQSRDPDKGRDIADSRSKIPKSYNEGSKINPAEV